MTDLNSLEAAHRAVAQLAVQVSDWDAPTPCPGLSTRDVLAHLIGGEVMITDLLSDRPFDPGAVGEVSAARYTTAGSDLEDAYRQPGATEKTIMAPFGPASGGQMLVMRTIENVVHGWDIAVAQGLPTDELDALAEPLIPISQGLLDQLGDVVAERRPFADSVPVPSDARPLDRLVALLGRDPQRVTA